MTEKDELKRLLAETSEEAERLAILYNETYQKMLHYKILWEGKK